ncbi:MAG: hypothetical protein ACI8QZ_004279 [Chlamydiales bacterium]|jgi:uncharacterized protein (DUF486 family)
MEPITETEATNRPSGSGGAPAGSHPKSRLRSIVVPLMLSVASLFMAFAWLGHLRFKELPFLHALGLCWLLVLPEYFLNVKAIRMGHGVYSIAQMAAFRLCSGVVFVALVARFVLSEALGPWQMTGFGVMIVAMLLIAFPENRAADSARRAGSPGDGA